MSLLGPLHHKNLPKKYCENFSDSKDMPAYTFYLKAKGGITFKGKKGEEAHVYRII